MELSRIKILLGGFILQLLFSIAVPLPYNKYGRQCSDIGCLSSQVCVMAYDSCSLSQREGNDCGRYPTCKKNTEAGLAAGPSDTSNTDLYSNKPAPPKAAAPAPSDHDVLASLGLTPDAPSNGNNYRPSAPAPAPAPAPGGYNPYANPYPTLPSRQPPAPAQPHYPPTGGNNYHGGGGGGGRPSGQYDGSNSNVLVPTPKPTASSGGFFSGILGGIQNAVSNAVKQQVGTYINQRLGIGPAAGQAGGAGGLGGLLDARNFIDSKSFGGLLNSERKPTSAGNPTTGTGGSSASNVGPYPVTVDQRSQVYAPQPYTQAQRSRQQSSAAGTPAPYGWKLD